jgi:hypothetical protein
MDLNSLRARGISPTLRGKLTNPIRRLLWPFNAPYFGALLAEIEALRSEVEALRSRNAASPSQAELRQARFARQEIADADVDALRKDLTAIAHRLASLEARGEPAGDAARPS